MAIISILSSLPENEAVASVNRLLSDKSPERRLAALNIIKNWLDKGERVELGGSLITDVKAISRPTSKEEVLIDSILASALNEDNNYSESNGFGLYNPSEARYADVWNRQRVGSGQLRKDKR